MKEYKSNKTKLYIPLILGSFFLCSPNLESTKSRNLEGKVGLESYKYVSNEENEQNHELDDNWEWYEMRYWWFFPEDNIAIKKYPPIKEINRKDIIYLVPKCEFRAMNGVATYDTYNSPWLSDKDDESFIPDHEGPELYEELNNRKLIYEGHTRYDEIQVGSSPNATVTMHLPFYVAEIRIIGTDLEKGEDLCRVIPKLEGVILLHSFGDSVQLTTKSWPTKDFWRDVKERPQ